MLKFNINYFILALLLFAAEVLIAIYAHDTIIRPYGGDLLVVILIYCIVKAFVNAPVWPTTLGTLAFAYAVEVSQYFKLAVHLGLGHSKTAMLLIGSAFAWGDMLAYTLGIIIVLLAEYAVAKYSLYFKSAKIWTL
ncbi:DUF2809 domain-containing protein [Mucilaginibacter gynuensis]|uniref:DUF2809 domain-containing protein n=1 Tax=Mucilaginibacter gynuensis TaxID=1302236 RepID=A0ABP8FRA0_9SPHI